MRVQHGAEEHDAGHPRPVVLAAYRHALTLPGQRQIPRRDRHFHPESGQIGNGEQFRLGADRGAENGLPGDHPAGDGRPHFQPAQHRHRLAGQPGYLGVREPERGELLARQVETDPGLLGRAARLKKVLFGGDALFP